MHDTADLERRGVLSVFVASQEFQRAAEAQSSAIGFASPFVLTEHPIQDRTDEEMQIIAEKALGELLDALTE